MSEFNLQQLREFAQYGIDNGVRPAVTGSELLALVDAVEAARDFLALSTYDADPTVNATWAGYATDLGNALDRFVFESYAKDEQGHLRARRSEVPTGYTADVGDGKVTEFSDFALTCARGFGAMILLRDSDQSLEATRRYIESGAYLDGSSYYPDELARAKDRLAELCDMTVGEAFNAARAEADRIVAENEHRAAETAETRERYEAMLARVEAWEPPTPEHVRLKEFMGEQLRESIRFDCSTYEHPVPDVNLSWQEKQIVDTVELIAYLEGKIAEERERNEQHRAWVTALLDSLEGVPA